MKIILITPGTGSYYCGVCMRDNALAKELIRQGHEALMLPLYLPLQLDEAPVPGDAPTFFGGVNVFLQERFSIFRHTPTWFDWIFDRPFLLRRLAGGAQDAHREIVGRMTCSMLEGEHGHQRKELRRLINWLKKHQKPDAIWLSTMLLTGFARQLKKEIGVPVLASLQGEDEFLDGLPKPWNRRAWEIIIERSNDVDLFVAPSRFYATLMCGRMRLRAEQVRLIPNGISIEGYDEPEPPLKPPVIGYLARMRKEKGLSFVVQAFLMLKKRPGFENVKLRIAGSMTADDEVYVKKLQAEIAAEGWTKDVEFLPNISREEKIKFLKGLTLLSVPTLYPEAFGLYVLEAWAAGVPVVQPRQAAFTELVEGTGAGRLFEDDRADDLVSEWSQFLAAPEVAREAGLRGREAVLHGPYSIARMTESFLAATREAVGAVPVAH
jgi:glycosyltransferase involved in cell wall biosynthesis